MKKDHRYENISKPTKFKKTVFTVLNSHIYPRTYENKD